MVMLYFDKKCKHNLFCIKHSCFGTLNQRNRKVNLLLPILKKYVVNEEMPLPMKPEELAVNFEYWIKDFKRIWRMRNKESELYRITELFSTLCKELRRFSEL